MVELDKTQLGQKIRLLTLATLGFENIGRELSYSKIATALQIDSSEVERWVIDGDFLLIFQPHITDIF